jgi:hypothetical protein
VNAKECPDSSVDLVYVHPPFDSDIENQKVAGGILVTLEKPTKQMRTEAADAGRFVSKLWHDKDYAKIQILTVEGLLNGTERVDAPPQLNPFAMAARESVVHKQSELL